MMKEMKENMVLIKKIQEVEEGEVWLNLPNQKFKT